MVRKPFFFFCTFFSLVFICVMPAQQNPSITIVNNTGYDVYYAFIVQTAAESWGDDYLDSTLKNGESFTITLPFPINIINRYDIQLIDLDGDFYTKWDVLVTPDAKVVFTFDDYSYTEAPQYFGPPVTIVNNTGYLVWWVYICSSSDTEWGQERLGSNNILYNSESVTLNLPYLTDAVNRYDIQLVDSDLFTYTQYNVLVSPNMKIVFTSDDADL